MAATGKKINSIPAETRTERNLSHRGNVICPEIKRLPAMGCSF